jgi:hypothetical protein
VIALALLTPDPADKAYAARTEVQTLVKSYQALFARFDVEILASPWTVPPPAKAQGALANLAWGYHFQYARWLDRLALWDARTPLINPPDLLAWNSHKGYLADLADRGVPVIPTVMLAVADHAALAAGFETLGVDEAVLKPAVSAGSFRTLRLQRDAPVQAYPDMMLQPFLPSVAEEGEISLFMFNGALSHAVIKRAAAGDFRVQPQYGGQMTPYAPDEEARSLAEAALAVAPRRPVYARVDMARLPDGRLALMELEAVEPDLYFAFAPDGGEAFARAVLHALASPIAAS